MSKPSEIKRCTVAFNLADPFQRQLYEYAQQFTNFSAYGKRLIQRDMEGGQPATKKQAPAEVEIVDKALMKGLI